MTTPDAPGVEGSGMSGRGLISKREEVGTLKCNGEQIASFYSCLQVWKTHTHTEAVCAAQTGASSHVTLLPLKRLPHKLTVVLSPT